MVIMSMVQRSAQTAMEEEMLFVIVVAVQVVLHVQDAVVRGILRMLGRASADVPVVKVKAHRDVVLVLVREQRRVALAGDRAKFM